MGDYLIIFIMRCTPFNMKSVGEGGGVYVLELCANHTGYTIYSGYTVYSGYTIY